MREATPTINVFYTIIMKVRIKKWAAVAVWKWIVANDETECGICRVKFDGCCPDCRVPGDDCPIGTSPLGSRCALSSGWKVNGGPELFECQITFPKKKVWATPSLMFSCFSSVTGRCKHSFHMHCIVKWLAVSHVQCPMCRQEWHFSD